MIANIIPYKETPILAYHKINNIGCTIDRFRLSVPPTNFEMQMVYIRENKKCIRLEDYVRYFKKGKDISCNSVVITFDDGYEDNYTNAFPILKKHRLTATFFIITDLVGMTNKWDEGFGEPKSKLMSWDQIVKMSRARMSLGSHGCMHRRLTTCTNEILKHEITYSKAVLEERLNRKINLFSYPYGDSDLRTTQIVKTSGYAGACSDRKAEMEDLILYNLNRIPVYSTDSSMSFKIKVSGWYPWIQNVLTTLKIKGLMRKIEKAKKHSKKTPIDRLTRYE